MHDIVLSELQIQLYKILWVAVSSAVELHVVRRRSHLQLVCLQDVVSVDQTNESKYPFDSCVCVPQSVAGDLTVGKDYGPVEIGLLSDSCSTLTAIASIMPSKAVVKKLSDSRCGGARVQFEKCGDQRRAKGSGKKPFKGSEVKIKENARGDSPSWTKREDRCQCCGEKSIQKPTRIIYYEIPKPKFRGMSVTEHDYKIHPIKKR
ncbi:hypothetical protein TNCV_2564621 [Trichonephila clavipes]|nr:hypothetical protein TNCV_2564621 [Trichonephila clavipes]